MNFTWDISFGQLIPLIVVVVGGGWGMVKLGFYFKDHVKQTADDFKFVNKRLTDMGDGLVTTQKEFKEFKEYAGRHFVEVGDLAEVRTGFQSSMHELRGDMREAIGTMGDVRDSVIRVEAKLFPDNPKPPGAGPPRHHERGVTTGTSASGSGQRRRPSPT